VSNRLSRAGAFQWGAQPRGSKGDRGHDGIVPVGHRVQYSILRSPLQGKRTSAETQIIVVKRQETTLTETTLTETTTADPRKGISDVDPRSFTGTISGTHPPLSPGTGPRLWLHRPVHTRVMGSSINARKESHGGSSAPRDIGSGFDNHRAGRPEALFCQARSRGVGMLAEENRKRSNAANTRFPSAVCRLL